MLQWGRNFIVAETATARRKLKSTRKASMGPQLYRCGNSDCYGWSMLVKELQWGRNFIVAETCGPLSMSTASTGLQWGRNFIVAETRRRHRPLAGCVKASMGPQLYRCGNSSTTSRRTVQDTSFNGAATLSLRKPVPFCDPYCAEEYASMGPQLYRCGNLTARRSGDTGNGASMGPQLYRCGNQDSAYIPSDRPSMLQWGRNFIVAETSRCRAPVRCVFPLQWGRNFIVAETPSPGAAVRSSVVLQWGRNFIVAETHTIRLITLLPPIASMGPQLYRCGNPYHTPDYSAPTYRFNGAATLSLRKLYSHTILYTSILYASMGPQLYRCGNNEPLVGPLVHGYASMGPQLYRCGNVRLVDPVHQHGGLQWGRNFIVAETSDSSIRYTSTAGFNGAATLSLRKLMVGFGQADRKGRFNGAATLSLRKPGKRLAATKTQTVLQWGRNFIVAETRDALYKSFPIWMLQWGRNFIVAETDRLLAVVACGAVASMGPQLYRCGNVLCVPDVNTLGPASMGPQLYRCGNVQSLPDHEGPEEASMGPQLYRCGNVQSLPDHEGPEEASMGPQLYRCGNAVLSPRNRARIRRFNGAATLSLRKPGWRSAARCTSRRFNGAATLSLRKLARAASMAESRYCFNGAATLSLRKLSQHLFLFIRQSGVSMGPQLYRCGNRV